MSETIRIYRRETQVMSARAFATLSRTYVVDARVVEEREALVATNGTRTLVYAQPGTKMGGVLFGIDQTVAAGAPIEDVVEPSAAARWAQKILTGFPLMPRDNGNARVELDVQAFRSEGLVDDGRETRSVNVATCVYVNARVDGLPVAGPRGKVRMLFKRAESPAILHAGLWSGLTPYEERRLVTRDEALAVVDRKMQRRDTKLEYQVVDVSLVYTAPLFNGGPDVLAPEYRVVVEYPMPRGIEGQGPRQLIPVRAYA